MPDPAFALSALDPNIYIGLENSNSFFGRGAPPIWFDKVGAREAHQHKVGGIVHTTGPDPFRNCEPKPSLRLKTLCGFPVIDLDFG